MNADLHPKTTSKKRSIRPWHFRHERGPYVVQIGYQTTARVISFDNTDKPSWVCGDKQTNHSQYHFVWQWHLSTLAHTPASTLNVNCRFFFVCFFISLPPSGTNARAIANSSGAKQTAHSVRADKAGIRMAHLLQYKCPAAVAM